VPSVSHSNPGVAKEDVGVGYRTIFVVMPCSWLLQISAGLTDPVTYVVSTCLPSRRIDVENLNVCALNRCVCTACDYHTVNEVCERRGSVHEVPEL
jgi:hypothetical protein